VHLSIFNSDYCSWKLSLVAGIILALAGLTALEITWRMQGHIPCVIDDKDLWAYHRNRLTKNSEHIIVLSGASRILLNISLPEMKNLLPAYTIVQLGIDGTHPPAVLRDLAKDPDFRGIVLFSVIASGLEKRNWDHQQEFIDYYHSDFSWSDALNRFMSTMVQAHLVISDPHVMIKPVLLRYLKIKKLPSPRYLITYSDRRKEADYSKLNINKHKQKRLERLAQYYEKDNAPLPLNQWIHEVVDVYSWVRQIENRGGKVIFLRLPTKKAHWEMDEKFYPRTLYWDRFVQKTGVEAIHFKDFPVLDNFDCPDTSHLDFKDTKPFTRALCNILCQHDAFKK
jgi:hypothetical protein